MLKLTHAIMLHPTPSVAATLGPARARPHMQRAAPSTLADIVAHQGADANAGLRLPVIARPNATVFGSSWSRVATARAPDSVVVIGEAERAQQTRQLRRHIRRVDWPRGATRLGLAVGCSALLFVATAVSVGPVFACCATGVAVGLAVAVLSSAVMLVPHSRMSYPFQPSEASSWQELYAITVLNLVDSALHWLLPDRSPTYSERGLELFEDLIDIVAVASRPRPHPEGHPRQTSAPSPAPTSLPPPAAPQREWATASGEPHA